MGNNIMKFIFGKSLKSAEIRNQKFNVFWGLPVLASDAISSVAYAGEAILVVLIGVLGIKSYQYMFYVALCIAFLLFLLIFSYRQTIDAYPNGGGSYVLGAMLVRPAGLLANHYNPDLGLYPYRGTYGMAVRCSSGVWSRRRDSGDEE